MSFNRPFPSAFQNMNRNRNPVPAAPSPPEPNPLEMNETNFPSLGGTTGPTQMRVFDTSFAKRVEQTKLVEEYKRKKEEREKEMESLLGYETEMVSWVRSAKLEANRMFNTPAKP